MDAMVKHDADERGESLREQAERTGISEDMLSRMHPTARHMIVNHGTRYGFPAPRPEAVRAYINALIQAKQMKG